MITLNDFLWCETCELYTKHENRGGDVCCVECHSITVTELTDDVGAEFVKVKGG